MTLRETLLDAVMTTLAGTTGVGVDLYRSRGAAIRAEAMLSLTVRPVADDPVQIVVPFMDRSLDIELLVRARGEIPDALADDTVADAHAKLMANRTLSGACLDIEEGPTSWTFDEADTPLCEIMLRYRIRYRTADNSLTS